jgi:TRAP-type C4-dicarboxylate transport system permease small subunit
MAPLLPKKVSRGFLAFSYGVDRVATFLAVVTLVAMTATTTLQIICRFFFTALSWSEELARYLMIWLTFLGASMGVKRGTHIAVTFAVSPLAPRWRQAMALVVHLLAFYFFLLVTYYGWRLMNFQAYQVSAGLGISMRYVYVSLPVGGALCAFHVLAEILQILAGEKSWP